MKTTELFEFRFVDRDIERNTLNDFLIDNDEISLWIKGDRGFGKTEFFHYGVKHQDKFELCYFDIKAKKNSVDILSDFIIELQKHCELDFLSSVKKKYKHFYNNTYQKINRITSEIFPKITNIVSVILDTSNYVVTFSNEQKSPVDLINDYLKIIIKKRKLCICLDNFSRCNLEVAQIFLNILKNFIKEQNFKSCVITTNEDLTIELKEEILHNLPLTKIDIKKLEKYDYFYQILNPIFIMDDFSNKELEYIYQKCDGSPKKLSTIISKLLENDGIILPNNKKAIIKKNILFSILQTNHLKFDENDFTTKEKWIIFSYLCLHEQTAVQYLKEFALYVSKKNFLYQAYNESLFGEILLGLVDSKVMIYGSDDKISTAHDQDYIELKDIFNNSNLKNIFSQHAYEFLIINKNFPEREELLCQHAYIANINNWHKLNFRYGKNLFKKKLFYDAERIFSNLKNAYNKLYSIELLLLAVSSYETGRYHSAIERFNLICIDKLYFKKARYYYFFYQGKTYNNIGETEKAVDCLQNALKEVEIESKEYVHTLNVLHMYCIEIPGKSEQAKLIFQKIYSSYKEMYPLEWANTMRGCQNFFDDIKALEILEEADNILTDDLEKAYLKTTKGFIFIKLNQIRKGEEQFRDASIIIKKLKSHEYSYSANDLAVCYMIERNYRVAKQILLEALFWNRTNYGEIVLNTHLMICSLYLEEESDTIYYFNILNNYMNNNKVVDPVINRKVYINLAIVCSKQKNEIMERAFFQRANPYVAQSSSEWRYHILTNQISEDSINIPTKIYQTILEFDPWFLIYAHD